MNNTDVQYVLDKSDHEKIPSIPLNNHMMHENNSPINVFDYNVDDEFDAIRSMN